MKLIVLGLDAMNIPLVRKLSSEMPTLNRLLDEGASGILESVIPPFTGATWVSFQTGKNIGKHGILGFFKYDNDFNIQLTSGKDLKEKPFYVYCNEYGKKCFVMNLPCTEPPRIEGDIIHSWLAVKNEQEGLTHPSNLAEKFPSIKQYKNYPDRSKSVKKYLQSTLEIEKSRIEVIKEVVASKAYDLSFFMVGGTDWLQHKAFLELMDGKNNWKARISKELLSAVDESVKWILENLDSDTSLIILSDHGFREYQGKFFINSWLKNNNYLMTAKEGKEVVEHISQTKQKKSINISKMVVFLKKHPFLLRTAEIFYDFAVKVIPFNVIKQPKIDFKQSLAFCPSTFEQMIYFKRDLPEEKKESLRKELIEKINQLPGIEAVDPTKYYSGKFAQTLGDVLLIPKEWELDSTIGDQEFLKMRRCFHGMEGIFIGYGPAFKKGEVKKAELIDVMPTMLYLMGIPVPEEVDGKILKERINSEMIVPAEKKKEKKNIQVQDKEKAEINEILEGIKF